MVKSQRIVLFLKMHINVHTKLSLETLYMFLLVVFPIFKLFYIPVSVNLVTGIFINTVNRGGGCMVKDRSGF